MGLIKLLDEKTVNQIAAGEVIEQAASCVKELVENAIDAKAKKVSVLVEAGGQLLIEVVDDGCGMSFEDANLACLRHATSKIEKFDDLFALSTFGFRGEALSSIAAVSECSLLTAQKLDEGDLQKGTHITISGGNFISGQPTTCLKGTKIQVKKLFFNTPARKKFLKAPARSNFEIVKTMTQIALAHPDIEIELVLDEKKEFSVRPTSCKERVQALLGYDFFAKLMPIEAQRGFLSLQGFVGIPPLSFPTRSRQYIFVNGRPVQSLPISYAMKEGYGTSLPENRHPACVLFLHTEGQFCDFNVHPQKKEVKFRDEEALKAFLVGACQEALFSNPTMVPIEQKTANTAESHPNGHRVFQPTKIPSPYITCYPIAHAIPQTASDYEAKTIAFPTEQAKEVPLFTPSDIQTPFFHVIGSFKEYIFLSIPGSQPDAVSILDAKGALARIAFEELLQQSKVPCSSQALLQPFFIEFPVHEAKICEGLIPYLKNIGFDIRLFGNNGFLVEAVPTAFEASFLESFLRDLVKEEEEEPSKLARKIARASTLFTNKKFPLSSELAYEITKKLFACKDPFFCPFGKPLFATMSKEEIEKKFRVAGVT